MQGELQDDKRNITARIAQSAYVKGKENRQNLINEYEPTAGAQLKLLDKYTDRHHSTFEDGSGNIYLGIRGTDFSNKQSGRNEDLLTDIVLAFGLEGLTPRYRRSERLLNKLKSENPDKNIILSGHSLGGRISRDLGYKYNLENHNYAPGTTYLHNKTNILKYLPGADKKKAKSHIYITDGGDPISVSSYGDLLSTVHVVPTKKVPRKQRSFLQPHNIDNFFD